MQYLQIMVRILKVKRGKELLKLQGKAGAGEAAIAGARAAGEQASAREAVEQAVEQAAIDGEAERAEKLERSERPERAGETGPTAEPQALKPAVRPDYGIESAAPTNTSM